MLWITYGEDVLDVLTSWEVVFIFLFIIDFLLEVLLPLYFSTFPAHWDPSLDKVIYWTVLNSWLNENDNNHNEAISWKEDRAQAKNSYFFTEEDSHELKSCQEQEG